MYSSRRSFLRKSISITSSRMFFPALGSMTAMASSLAQSDDYKALVYVFLAGGNDAYNCLIPLESQSYTRYRTMRSQGGVFIDTQNSTVHPLSNTSTDGYALHSSLSPLLNYWDINNPSLGKLAIIKNISNLIEPIDTSTWQTYDASPKPTPLLAHMVQDGCAELSLGSLTGLYSENGWGSRLRNALLTAPVDGVDLSMISFSGNRFFMKSTGNQAIVLAPETLLPASSLMSLKNFYARGASSSNPMVRAYANTMSDASSIASKTNDVFSNTNNAAEIAFKNSLNIASNGTVNTYFHKQLLSTAKFIANRSYLGSPHRQIFMCVLGGFDTHGSQRGVHDGLLSTLSSGLNAFYHALQAVNDQDKVTLFTMSDFGRTLSSNASAGTDHAWAGHNFILGGAVRGGFYGKDAAFDVTTTSSGALRFSGADIMPGNQQGVIIPSTSIDQMAATLAKWFGVPDSSLPEVFPNLPNFPVRDLSFMG